MTLTLPPTLARSAPPRHHIPADVDEMYRGYFIYLRNLVQLHGIDEVNADDVVQKIFEKVITTDMLSDFDPTLTFSERTTVFRTFLSRFTLSYLQHYRQAQNRDKAREPQIVDMPVQSPRGPVTTWGEVYSPSYEETYDELRLAEFMKDARTKLGAIKPKRADSHNLLELFEAIAEQILSGHADVDVPALARKFKRSGATIYVRLSELRAAMEEVGLYVRF